jgi:DNA-binding response OmpR family regulator
MAESFGVDTLPARLLIVDDEHNLRIALGDLLRLHGYQVDEAASGTEALARLERASYDLMLLDMVMPGMHGIEVMKRARQLQPDLSIIVLTANATVDSAIAAVKSDVTDYMLKPCSPNDLYAAVARALQERARQQRRQRMLELVGEAMNILRDGDESEPAVATSSPAATSSTVVAGPVNDDQLRVGPLTLDRAKRLVTLEADPAHPVELTEGEVSVLETLMRQPDQVLSVKQLANSALGYQGLDKWTVESVVRSCVFRLRQKIQPSTDSPQLICTVRGRGYFFKSNDKTPRRAPAR